MSVKCQRGNAGARHHRQQSGRQETRNAPDFRIEDYARTHPFAYAEEELPDLRAYITRQ
jgi:hypothetical protein